jgi:hypothetical protein
MTLICILQARPLPAWLWAGDIAASPSNGDPIQDLVTLARCRNDLFHISLNYLAAKHTFFHGEKVI